MVVACYVIVKLASSRAVLSSHANKMFGIRRENHKLPTNYIFSLKTTSKTTLKLRHQHHSLPYSIKDFFLLYKNKPKCGGPCRSCLFGKIITRILFSISNQFKFYFFCVLYSTDVLVKTFKNCNFHDDLI